MIFFIITTEVKKNRPNVSQWQYLKYITLFIIKCVTFKLNAIISDEFSVSHKKLNIKLTPALLKTSGNK